jgi:hypothetical protein
MNQGPQAAADESVTSEWHPHQQHLQSDITDSNNMTSRKSVIVTHNPVLFPISLPKKRKAADAVDEADDSEPDRKSPVPKKQYRSSDARWRKNLKTAFRILRDISCPQQSHIPVAGKNMRRDILTKALTVIEQLEDDISYIINIRNVRDKFHELELKNHAAASAGSGSGQSGAVVPVSRIRNKKKTDTQSGVLIVKQEQKPAATFTHYVGPYDRELAAATDSINVKVDDSDVDQDMSHQMSHENSVDFDFVFSAMQSTPKRDEAAPGCLMRKSKDKFAPSKKPENVRRRLNMDEADETYVPSNMTGGGDGPAFDQAVDEYLETSFTQLLHMSQGGTLYYDPAVPVQVDGSFSEGPVSDMTVACDVEVESCDPVSLNYSVLSMD